MKATWIDSGKDITAKELDAQGILNRQLPTEGTGWQERLEAAKKELGYVSQDQVDMTPQMPKFEEICKKFSIEHYHPGDEVRFLLSGAGVWHIRSLDDRWMKVEVVKGDFIVVPENRYHLFYLTQEQNIQCVRLFKDNNAWTQVYRKDVEAAAAK
jgi:1,2-dihydroxy-3-keto-5-methylthiopentene dioxygenase